MTSDMLLPALGSPGRDFQDFGKRSEIQMEIGCPAVKSPEAAAFALRNVVKR
ncbi:hypothetical protein [Minwuia thermotolerans]|uniref:hypothetical protein n=1 Tax=Minwuia thermotolerans TaxID=2056226 RepID=UPI0013DDC2DF|nr:hypothetical protein [Minwuia thermotolerans]